MNNALKRLASEANVYPFGLCSIINFAVNELNMASPDATIITRRNPATKESSIDR